MKRIKGILSLILALLLTFTIITISASAAISTPATGYNSAADVVYRTFSQSGKTVIANWGARSEVAKFLTTYANSYYTGSYAYDTMSTVKGGTTQSNAPSSALYSTLKTLMSSTQTFYTYYDGNKNVRDYYKYTDCVKSDTSMVSIIYLGDMVTSSWNQGSIWNQEHIWPQSKLSSSQQIGDIMHLRPSNPSVNSSRGNTAYGESGSYYTPDASVRGDCARMVLYMYVRWGATSKMWGTSGVMENMNVLLDWMEEDPVDTWEMGRNDSVQSITGVRNVFVDYPEYAWLLFGQEIPNDMTTPSGKAKNTSTGSGSGNTSSNSGSTSTSTPSGTTSTPSGSTSSNTTSGSTSTQCKHTKTVLNNVRAASCAVAGYSGDIVCTSCNAIVEYGQQTNKTAHVSNDGNNLCDVCGATMNCLHKNKITINQKDATCVRNGYSGDQACQDCHGIIKEGNTVPKTGIHAFGEWSTADSGAEQHTCTECGLIETKDSANTNTTTDGSANADTASDFNWIWIIVGAAVLACVTAAVIIIVIKKKK